MLRRLLKKQDFIGSMSRKGNCWDNAVAESFFDSMKQEHVQWRHYQTRLAAQARYTQLHRDVLQQQKTALVFGLQKPRTI
jgi:transposase InsO family protein